MFFRSIFLSLSLLLSNLYLVSAQKTTFSLFAGPVFTHMENTLENDEMRGDCASKTNPTFGASFSLSPLKNIAWRTGAAYVNKSYQYNLNAAELAQPKEIEVHHKIESVKLFTGLVYTIPYQNILLKPMANITYSNNKYVAAEYIYPAFPDYTSQYGEPLGDVNKGDILDSWGWEAGIGIQPKKYPFVELNLLYSAESAMHPFNYFNVPLSLNGNLTQKQVSWQGKMSYASIQVVLHLSQI